MHTRAFLIDAPPQRYVGADIATHRHLVSLGGTATIFTPGAQRRYVLDGVLVVPWNLENPDLEHLDRPADVFVTLPYGSAPLRRAISHFEATVKVLMAHSATEWTTACFHGMADDFDVWAVNSRATAEALGVADDPRTTVIHPELDPVFRDAARDWLPSTGSPQSAPTVMLVNPIEPKGVQVYRALMTQRPDWRYVVVAGGYGKPTTTDLVATAARVGAQLELIDAQVPPEKLLELYRRADVLVQPSLHESFGLVALEARTVGTPVVTTDLPGPREALSGFSDGVGLIPAPPDPQSLEEAVRGLLGL